MQQAVQQAVRQAVQGPCWRWRAHFIWICFLRSATSPSLASNCCCSPCRQRPVHQSTSEGWATDGALSELTMACSLLQLLSLDTSASVWRRCAHSCSSSLSLFFAASIWFKSWFICLIWAWCAWVVDQVDRRYADSERSSTDWRTVYRGCG